MESTLDPAFGIFHQINEEVPYRCMHETEKGVVTSPENVDFEFPKHIPYWPRRQG